MMSRLRSRPEIARVERLRNVDGLIAYDVPAAPVSGGGTRLAPDITEAEMLLLARAMTYKLASIGLRIGGAKIGVRASAATRQEALAGLRDEIGDRLAAGTLMTGPDLGTSEADFAGLPTPGGSAGLAARAVDGVPIEERLTGYGVVAAIAAAVGSDLQGVTVALEGFGKMGASIARELDARGARVVAVSTLVGCAMPVPGESISVAKLIKARDRWGDDLVHHLDLPVRDSQALWSTDCDVLVPGARPAALDERSAAQVRARAVLPVANAPYTSEGLRILHDRGIAAHSDFVVSAGGAMTYLAPRVAGSPDIAGAREAIDRMMGELVREAMASPEGPYLGAARRAERFLATWLPDSQLPSGPPLA